MEITRSENNTPQLSLVIKAPIDAVWQALRDRKKLSQWHGWDTPTLADEIENIYFTNATEETAEDKKILIVNGGDAFILEANGDDSARLTLVRADLSGDPEWDGYYDNITEGWVSFVQQLRFMLERASNQWRKTEFTSMTMQRNEITTKLNLENEKETTKFKGSFRGEKVSGEVWFSTPNQLGLVINEWGPGLLILQFSESGCITTHLS